jgi:hypothetical protein
MSSSVRRTLAAAVAFLAVLVGTAVSAEPARAGLFEGDVQNLIPASSGLTVHIASFFGGEEPANRTCAVHKIGSYPCFRSWLPQGTTDDQIKGNGYDTDGFTVAEASFEVRGGAAVTTVPGGTFFKIEDPISVICRYIGGRAICYL